MSADIEVGSGANTRDEVTKSYKKEDLKVRDNAGTQLGLGSDTAKFTGKMLIAPGAAGNPVSRAACDQTGSVSVPSIVTAGFATRGIATAGRPVPSYDWPAPLATCCAVAIWTRRNAVTNMRPI